MSIKQTPIAEGLHDLAVARTGREVEWTRVQITDEKAFGVVMEAMSEIVQGLVAQGKEPQDEDLKMIADAQDDGRLIVRAPTAVRNRIFEIPAGKWRELTPEQYVQVFEAIDRRIENEPDKHHELMESMSEHINAGADHLRARGKNMGSFVDRMEQVMMILDRSLKSMEFAKDVIPGVQGLSKSIDEWLATDHQYFVFIYPRSGTKLSITASDYDALVSDILPRVAKRIGALTSATWLQCPGVDREDDVMERWVKLGGVRPEV